jgi:chromosome segregation protein
LKEAVVVADEGQADQALGQLRERASGRATVVVRQAAARAPEWAAPPEVTPLIDRVQVSDADRSVVAALLAGWCAADVLPHADDLPAGVRVVTPQGDWAGAAHLGADAAPAVRYGGAPDAGAPPPTRAEQRARLAELDRQVSQLAQAAQQTQQRVDALSSSARDDIRRQRHELSVLGQQLRTAQQNADRAAVAVEAAQTARAQHATRLEQAEQARTQAKAAIDPLMPDLTRAEGAVEQLRSTSEQAEAAVRNAEAASADVSAAFTTASLEAAQQRTRVDTLERERGRIEEAKRQTAERQARDSEQAQAEREVARERAEQTAATQQQLDGLVARRAPLDQAAQAAEDAVLGATARVSDVEKHVREARRQQAQAAERMSAVAVARAQVEARRQALEEDWADAHDTPLADETADVPADFDSAQAREELAGLKAKLGRIGAVNALAVEDYDAASERLAFLQQQRADLEEAEALLEETISEIDTAASERFSHTFAQIQTSFQSLFTDLFGAGAHAELTLADPSDLLDSPVEVFARPSGKRPASISQLSGGEKTLTAIALLFAIYLVKPSPFCILDEVDAPLDEANVDRFMRIIRRFSSQTQFILVTHNKRTMELSDRLYGVTMQEPGVSKLVSVRFEEAAEMVG